MKPRVRKQRSEPTLEVTARAFNQNRSVALKKLKAGECAKVVITYHNLPLFEVKLCVRPIRE